MTEPLLTEAQVAELLGVSTRTVKRLVAAGRIRVVHPTPRSTRIESREVDAYVSWLRRAA